MKKSKVFLKFLFSMLSASFILPLCAVTADNPPQAKNIIKGLSYTVETGIDITYSIGQFGRETDPAKKMLTDGIRSFSPNHENTSWHVFYRGLSRTVTFELPEVRAVTGFKFCTLKNNSYGINLSDYYDLFVSENGTDWMLAFSYDNSDNVGGDDTGQYTISATYIGRFRAKYVRLKFRVEGYTYCDEIEIFGTDIDGTEAEFVKYTDDYNYKNAYNSGVEGCRDIALLYCGYKGSYDKSYVENTEEEMLYYCGYISETGEILDTMFDSVMFSAIGNTLPSGRNFKRGFDPPLMSDWQFFIDSVFDEEFNCGAIERALDKVKQATGKPDYTMKLIVNMPYPNISPSEPFGDIDGDGKEEYCRNREEQLKIFAWFMDAVIAKLEERNYKNIRLGGFYWESESIKPAWGKEESVLIKGVADLIHERKLHFFWIPLLFATGMDKVEELGFDVAMMQPNIPWTGFEKMKYEMFYGFTEALKKYGLGVEIEASWGIYNITSPDSDLRIKQFYSYLDAGYALGFMEEAAHAYYQDANPGIFYYLAKGKEGKQRQIYDDIHAFIKHTYKPHVTLSAKPHEAVAGEKCYGYVGIRKGAYANVQHGNIYLEVVSPPAHGTVDITASGDFTYTAEPGFEGMDSFTVVARNEFVLTEPLEVTISVAKKEDTGSADESAESQEQDNSSTTAESSENTKENDKNKNGFVIPAVVGGAVVAGGITAAVAANNKKKKGKKQR